jgi:hypothetical protein
MEKKSDNHVHEYVVVTQPVSQPIPASTNWVPYPRVPVHVRVSRDIVRVVKCVVK